jgi:hypothetical protein
MQNRLDAASRSAEHFLASVTETNANDEHLNRGTGDRSRTRQRKFCARMQGNGLISQRGDSFHGSVDETCRWLFTDSTDLLEDILHDPLSVDYFNVYLLFSFPALVIASFRFSANGFCVIVELLDLNSIHPYFPNSTLEYHQY